MTPARRNKFFLFSALTLAAACAVGLIHVHNTTAMTDHGAAVSTPQPANIEQHVAPSVGEPLPSDAHNPLDLKFEVLGGWKYVEGKTPIPDAVKQLNGKWVTITGFMLPINETKKMSHFIILQSLWGCCFGQAPAVNHVIVTDMAKGQTVEFYPDPVKVIGKFSVGETREQDYLVSIYRLEAFSVTAAKAASRPPPAFKPPTGIQ